MKRVLLSLIAPALLSAGTPAGTVIRNVATYQDDAQTLLSPEVTITVQPVCAPDISPASQTAEFPAGTDATVTFQVTQRGNAQQPLTLQAAVSGSHTPLNVTVAPNTVTPAPEQTVPVTVTLRGEQRTSGTLQLTVRCADGTQAQGTATLNVITTGPLIEKSLLPDPALADLTAESGQLITYALDVTNPNASAINVNVTDTLSGGLTYISATPEATVNGAQLNWAMQLEPFERRRILLRATVNEVSDDSEISNVAQATGEGQTAESTPPVILKVWSSQLLIDKQANGDTVVLPGSPVTYTVTVRNPSKTTVRDIQITDTFTPEMQLISGGLSGHDSQLTIGKLSARPSAVTVTGNQLRSEKFTLAPGELARWTYQMRLPLQSSFSAPNVAVADGLGVSGRIVAKVNSNVATEVIRTASGQERQADIAGRVYIDTNNNGRYDPVDRPIQGARIVMAGGRESSSDPQGRYAFMNVAVGDAALQLDLASVPAPPRTVRGDLGRPGARLIRASGIAAADFPLRDPGTSLSVQQTVGPHAVTLSAYSITTTGCVTLTKPINTTLRSGTHTLQFNPLTTLTELTPCD